jgi:hypothetical protein
LRHRVTAHHAVADARKDDLRIEAHGAPRSSDPDEMLIKSRRFPLS